MAEAEADDEADDDKASLRDRFFKDRRLLLALSVVLLAHLCFGISVERSADTLGLRFEIADPSKIWWMVWAAWLWTVVCYLQKLNSMRLLMPIYPESQAKEVRGAIADKVATCLVKRVALKHLRKQIPWRGRRLAVSHLGREDAEEGGQRELYTFVSVSAVWGGDDPNDAARQDADLQQVLKAHGWKSGVGSSGYEFSHCRFTRIIRVRFVPITDRQWVQNISRIWICLSTSFATDYLVPLLIGISPFVVWLFIVTNSLIASLKVH